jgi:hypothetical protein
MNVLITVKAATGDSKVTYTISRENNITAFATAKEAKSAPDVERFSTAKELAKLAEQCWMKLKPEVDCSRAGRSRGSWNAPLAQLRGLMPDEEPGEACSSGHPPKIRILCILPEATN